MIGAVKHYPWLVISILVVVNFFFMLGGHTLWDVDEPNNAVCAREMLEAANWFVPMFNGDLRFDKPILLYWLMMPAFALFGVSEFAARLPSALAMSVLVFVIWYFARRWRNGSVALMACVLLSSCLHVIVIARAATPDPLFILCVTAGLLALYTSIREGSNHRMLIVGYIALGFGVLAKGPAAIILPGMVMFGFIVLSQRWSLFGQLRPWMGLLIIGLIALPWYVTVGILTDGEWLEGFFFRHNFERFTDTLQGHRGFPGFYALTFLAGWFPWTGLILMALGLGVWRLAKLRDDPDRLFLLLWIGTFFLFFSIAQTKLPNYMLPAFPAAALLMALWWHKASAGLRKKAIIVSASAALLMGLSALVGAGIGLGKQWAGEEVFALIFVPVILAALIWFMSQKREGLITLAFGMMVTIALLVTWAIPGIDHHKIAPRLADAATKAGFNGKALATYAYFQPSLLFYHGGRLPSLSDMSEVEHWLASGKAIVMPTSSLHDIPKYIQPDLKVHDRVDGLYARKELVLVARADAH